MPSKYNNFGYNINHSDFYVYNKQISSITITSITITITNLPLDKRPRQISITRTEESGNIILASYPELKLKKD
jgi:hypothetical protein